MVEKIFKNKIYLINFIIFIIIFKAFNIDFKWGSKVVCLFDGKLDKTIEIILIVFPLIITMFSIIIPLQKDKICGIYHNDLRRLRNGGKPRFLHVILSNLTLFILGVIAMAFNYYITYITITVVLVIFNVYYLVVEIPIVVGSQKRVDSILSKKMVSDKKINPEIDNLLKKALKFKLFSRGFENTYNDLSKGKLESKKLKNILSLHDEFFKTLSELDQPNLENYIKDNLEMNIIDFLAISQANIDSIIDIGASWKAVDKKDLIDFENLSARLIYMYEKISRKVIIKEKVLDNVGKLLYQFFMKEFTKDDKKYMYKIINSLMVMTVTNNESWFIEVMHKKIFNDSYLLSNYENLFIHVSVYIHWAISKYSDKEIIDYMNENSYTEKNQYIHSWKELYCKIYKNSKISLIELKKIFDAYYVDGFSWEKTIYNKIFTMKIDDGFIFGHIIEWWIKNILQTETLLITNDYAKLIPEELISEVIDVLNNRFFEKGEFKNNINCLITNFYCPKFNKNYYYFNQKIMEFLKNYTSEINKKSISSSDSENANKEDSDSLDPKEVNNLRNGLIETFKTKVENSFGYDKKLEIENNEIYYFYTRTRKDFSGWKKSENERVELYIDNLISKLINDELAKLENNQSKEFSIEEFIKKINRLEPDFATGKLSWYISNLECDNVNDLDNITIIPENLMIEQYMVMKKDAFKINMVIDEELTRKYTRDLNIEEIEKIITEEYTKVKDDLFYYHHDDNKTWAYLNKNELISILQSKYINVGIFYKYAVSFYAEGVIYKDVEELRNLK